MDTTQALFFLMQITQGRNRCWKRLLGANCVVDRDTFKKHEDEGWMRCDDRTAALVCLYNKQTKKYICMLQEKYEEKPSEIFNFIEWNEDYQLWEAKIDL